jgi:RNA polymerase sigma factor (sigma-70 family)
MTGRPGADRDTADDPLALVFLSSYGDCVRFATGMFGDRVGAEDAVQDAFVRLWGNPPRMHDAAAAQSYVFRTIVKMARHRYRRDARRREVEATAVSIPVPFVIDVELRLDVRAALSALPARRRACVLMRYTLDLTERETASALGLAVGTVKSQTHKGLRQLAEQLREPIDFEDANDD